MDFPILYTGKDTGLRIPEFNKLESSEKDFYNNILKSSEFKYKEQKQNEADFLGMMKSNPALLITDKTRQLQADAIEQYNNKYATLYAKRKGNLNLSDKMSMQRDKEALTMFQNTLLSDQQRYLQEQEVINKDIKGYYDPIEFQKATQSMYDTGKYPTTGLIPKAQDILTAILKDKIDFGEQALPSIKDPTTGMIRSATANMTEEQAKMLVREKALENTAYMRGVIEQFNAQPESEQLKYLDANKNGIIDPAEKKTPLAEPLNLNNPILKWAEDYYAPQVRQIKYGEPKSLPGAKTGGGGSYGTDKAPLQASENKTFGSTNYVKYYNIPKRTTTNTPLQGGRVLVQGGDRELPRDKTSQGLVLTGVGENSNGNIELTFALPSDNYMNIGYPSGTMIALDAKNYPEFNNIELIKDGKKIRLIDLLNNTSTKATKDWSKYKR